MFGVGLEEAILIIIIFIVVVNPKDIPHIARAIGRAVAEFQRTINGIKDGINLHNIIDTEIKEVKEVKEVKEKDEQAPLS